MKFIKTSDVRSEYDVLEDCINTEETSRTRWIPSYHDCAKKRSASISAFKHEDISKINKS